MRIKRMLQFIELELVLYLAVDGSKVVAQSAVEAQFGVRGLKFPVPGKPSSIFVSMENTSVGVNAGL